MSCSLSLAVVLCMPAFAADLAPTGTLRVTFLGGNPVQGSVDAATGAVSGPVADIARELARRLNVPFKITPSAGVRAVLDSVKSNGADVGFLAFDATRAAEVDFSQPYSLAHNTYLVRADSPIQTIAGSDRQGVRIAASQGDSGELFLSRTLKHAELKSMPGLGVEEAHKMLAASEIDAFAANRQRLVEAAARLPNVRVLPDNFFAVEQAMIVARGDPTKLDSLNRFIDDMRASGFLKSALDRAKLSGVEVAPPRPR